LLGALPLAIGGGLGSELRRPLGISIVGGLIVSQLLTMFTTPVVYLALDRFTRQKKHSVTASSRLDSSRPAVVAPRQRRSSTGRHDSRARGRTSSPSRRDRRGSQSRRAPVAAGVLSPRDRSC